MLSSSRNCCSVWHLPRPPLLALAGMTLVVMLAGCKREVAEEAPAVRPVRTVVVEKAGLGETIVLTGQIQAEKEVALAFRIGGRIVERLADTGDRVTADQVLAKLDPQNELNGLRSAQCRAFRRRGSTGAGFQSLRSPADPAAARLGDARQFRPGSAGFANSAGSRGRRRGPG